MKQWMVRVAVAMVLAGAVTAALAWCWLHQPLTLNTSAPSEALLVVIAPQSSSQRVAQQLVDAGVQTPAWVLAAWFRLSGKARRIQAGTYELASTTTPLGLLQKLVSGDQALTRVTFIEGWTFARMRTALNAASDLRHDSAQWSDAQVMRAIGREEVAPEGRFLPSTYVLAKRSSDLTVLRQAALAMDTALQRAWLARQSNSAAQSPQDLLILASVIEKETQHAADRAAVSAVFNNRLRLGMRLQSDPTVIYGLGRAFDGNLRKSDLLTDGPYNSYTRAGLPPTPIAMPGEAALMAAAQPTDSDVLYFVGKGDGSSHFSRTLPEHNAAVRRYILNQ